MARITLFTCARVRAGYNYCAMMRGGKGWLVRSAYPFVVVCCRLLSDRGWGSSDEPNIRLLSDKSLAVCCRIICGRNLRPCRKAVNPSIPDHTPSRARRGLAVPTKKPKSSTCAKQISTPHSRKRSTFFSRDQTQIRHITHTLHSSQIFITFTPWST